MMKQKEIEIKNKKIRYHESKNDGNPVVLVHGMSSSSSIFVRQLIDSVLSDQFRFIAIDLLGHGNSARSDNPIEDYSLKGLGERLVDFSHKLNLKNAVYVGHNIGANILIEGFERLKTPLGLGLLGAIPFSNPISKNVFLKEEMFTLFAKPKIDHQEGEKMANMFVDPDIGYPDFIQEDINKTDGRARQYIFESINNGIYTDQLKIMEGIDVPVAVFCGENDQIINYEYLKSIKIPTIWRDRVQVLKDAGHIFFYESPADFNVSLETYLSAVFKE